MRGKAWFVDYSVLIGEEANRYRELGPLLGSLAHLRDTPTDPTHYYMFDIATGFQPKSG